MLLPVNVNDLLEGTLIESERLEFKKSWDPIDILHTICAFANDINNIGGGYICVGIEEIKVSKQESEFKVVGIKNNQVDAIQKKLLELSKKIVPNFFPILDFPLYKGKKLALIWVPGGDNRPYKAPVSLTNKKNSSAFYIRRYSSTVKASTEEEKDLFNYAAKIPFDDRINHQASLEDLDRDLMVDFLQEINSDLVSELANMPIAEIALRMNIAKGSSEYLKPVNVALMMFSKKPEIYFRGAYTEIIEYINDDEFYEKSFRGPIYKQIRNVLDYVKNKFLLTKVKKIEGQAEAEKLSNYPFAAIEEAIVNAFYHRSYENSNSIEINLRTDRIEILSYPGPLPPLDQKALKGRILARNYRNRRLGDFLKELRLSEARGTGLAKIRKSLKLNLSPEPEFITDRQKTYFLTVIHINPEFIRNRFEESSSENLSKFLDSKKVEFKQSVVKKLNHAETMKMKILDFCQEAKTKNQIFAHLGIGNNSVNSKAYIKPLLDEKKLKLTIPDKPKSSKQKYFSSERRVN